MLRSFRPQLSFSRRATSKKVELKPVGEIKLAATMNFKFEGKFRATVALRSSTAELGKARYSFDPPR